MTTTNKVTQKYSGVLIAVASVVFGLLIQPVIESLIDPLFDTTTKALLTGFVFLAFIVIIAVTTVALFVRNHDEQLSRFESKLTDTRNQVRLSSDLERVGISGATNDYPKEILNELRTNAKDEIRILQTYIGSVEQIPRCIFSAVKHGVKFKLLLLDPESETIQQRLRDIGLPDTIQVHKDAMERLLILIQKNNPPQELFEVRLYNGLPPFALYLADARLCLGFFWHGEHSPAGPHIFIDDSNSTLGKFALNTFDEIWQSSKQVSISS